MDKIRKEIKSMKDFDNMLMILSNRVSSNKPISNNGMLDGVIIGLMFANTRFTLDIFLGKNMGRMMDGTIQQIKQIYTWLRENEDALCDIIKNQ